MYRDEFPVTDSYVYFQHPAVAALPESTRRAMDDFLRDSVNNGCKNENRWTREIEEIRDRAADLLGVDSSRIGFVHNTSHGLTWLAESISFEAGETVVVPDVEFPANQFPWQNLKRKGVKFDRIDTGNGSVYTADVEEAIDDSTRVVSVSSVQFGTGFRADLKSIGELCHKNNIFFIVDGIQSVGWQDFNLTDLPIDAMVADGHKWMCGPEGAGILYLSETLQDAIEPAQVGWRSVKSPYQFSNPKFQLRSDAGVVELGSYNTIGLIGFGASLKLLQRAGIEEIQRRNLHLKDRLTEKLKEIDINCLHEQWDRSHHSPIVVFEPPGDSRDFSQSCLRENIQLSVRRGKIRIGLHFYNNEEDLDTLVEALRDWRNHEY